MTLLDGVGHLDDLVLDVLFKGADNLGHVEALPDLTGRHDGLAVLVGNVLTGLFLGGAADLQF